MTKTTGRFLSFLFASCLICCFTLLLAPGLFPQQTLGGITGTVTDTSGGAIIDSQVTLVADATKLTRTQKTNSVGSYEFVNLPIGTYSLTFTHEGFETLKIPSVPVQADRTATVNATLKVGLVGTTVTVEAAPLMNAEDTTNGYILETGQIESVPLSTGSFTSLAILSPGVNAELPSGTGANSGLGNQPIWANGQRDTSNSFLLNGVDASNLFNGKSTSQVASARVVNNTGVSGAASTSAAIIQSTASPYLAIGQALPTPAPDSIQELRVNTSMYDAQQGSTSGAHIDMSTASGTNSLHGTASVKRGTNALNAAPFFFNADPNIPADEKDPELHRVELGGTLGGALIKDKLFGFISYQHIHSSDQEIGLSRITVPAGLTDDRSPAALANLLNTTNVTPWCPNPPCQNFPATVNPVVSNTPGDISPVAYALLNYKLPNGQYLIPSADGQTPTVNFPENAIVPGTALFTADQGVVDLDWNATAKNTVALKYYYQRDPTIAPYAYSSVAGFAQHLDAGSQVFSIGNTQTLRSNLSVSETFGFIREKVYSTIAQPFGPSAIPSGSSSVGINTFGSTIFPGITIVDPYGNYAAYNTGCANSDQTCVPYANPVTNAALSIGQGSASQGAFTGVFQNRFMPSATAIWTKGKHTITFGGSYAYTQLDTRDRRTDTGNIGVVDFSQFLLGEITPYTSNGFVTSAYLQGDANRYYRAGQTGLYLQDKYQLRSNLNVTLGLRYDWNGGLTEKYGRVYNFDPSEYSFDGSEVTSTGFIIAGNNKQYPTKGVSNSTLTGRQWGFAPRLGIAWSPEMFHNKVVVRAGTGIYYDRGELFSYFSPGFAAGVITGGPFGVNQSPPFVNSQLCQSLTAPYLTYIPTCDPTQVGTAPGITGQGGSLSYPWGNGPQAPPTGNPANIINYLPTVSEIEEGYQLFAIAVYDRKNKLPYTINNTLDIQWQPRNDLLIQIGYVGNLGRHLVIPVPFNQAQIASPSHPINGQYYSYGYTLQTNSATPTPIGLPSIPGQPSVSPGNYLSTYEGGNVDLRVPYVGYSSESLSYEASGISMYNALQTHVEKRLSHGLQVGFSYTWSHATDEQSGLGLFYNGNNPLNLRDAYGTSDFDRTHVFNFNFGYQLPKFAADSTSVKGRVIDGWALEGVGIYQSGQPFSVVDYTGAVGSLFYGVNDGINNPVVPIKSGCTLKQAVTGDNGATPGLPALYAPCFSIPILQPGALGGAIPMNDPYETNFTTGQRNIFRQTWQRRLDVSFVKDTSLTERTNLKFSFDVFNVTNTPSFDIPIDDVSQNQYYNGFPTVGTGLPVLPSNCGTANQVNGFYNCPFGLGNVNKTIGSARQIQMALRLNF